MAASNYLTCLEVFRRLDDFVDRELSDVEMEQVRAHLETCAMCAREARFESGVIERLRSKIRQIDLPPLLRERIAERLRAERRDAPRDP